MYKRILSALLCVLLPLTALAEELSAPVDVSPAAQEASTIYTPGRESCGKPNCFWETPMDYTNTEAVWAMLTAPITVIDGNFRAQAKVYAEPAKDSQVIAEVTQDSQGVHLLENLDNGWSRIECYSSSFHGSKVKAWNALVVGYVETSTLKEVAVRTEYGLVVDKLTQRLYIYQDGQFLDELMVSTGLPSAGKGYNETRSGEYLLFSPTGAFPSESFTCNYGIRYDDGDLLHEIPHIKYENGSDYSRTEKLLGSRASHGCIRVQRKRTEQGLNMRWIWNNLRDKMKTRMVIWEDWQGRSIPLPAEDTALYYNLKGGKEYHDSPTCYGVLDKFEPMTAFTYGELESADFAKLDACIYCNPPRRAGEIEEINAAHAPTEEFPAWSPHWETLTVKKKKK